MTSWIEDVVARIDSGSTGVTVGVNLFANVLPTDVRSVAVGVFERAGIPPEDIYADLAAWERPGFLVLARSTAPMDGASAPNPTKARAEIWKAYRTLALVTNQTLSTASTRLFGAVDSGEPPYLYDIDPEGRHVFGFSGSAWVIPSTGAW